MKELVYFLDYNEDQVIPLCANFDLVEKYSKIIKNNNGETIFKFSTKEELMDCALEQSQYARNGSRNFKILIDEEMEEKINKYILNNR